MKSILLISPYWKEDHRWMVSSVKLAQLWQRMGYEVAVVCMSKEEGIDYPSPTLTIYRRKDIFFPDPWNYGIAFGFSRYVWELEAEMQPTHIVVNKLLFWTSLVTIPLKLRGRKVLLLTDALVGMTWQPRGIFPRIVMSIGAWTVGWAVLLASHRIVTFHPQPPRLLKRLGVFKKTRVIPTGLDPVPYSQLPLANSQKSETQNSITVTYVGRLESVKGVDDFLAATTSLLVSHPEIKIRVVGWSKKDHPLVEQYQDRVEFTGLRHDIPAVLRETDIFVLPSYSEGLSNALMEAMASGCACVASDVGGNAFLIENGISGFLFPAGDRAALAAHIRRLVQDASKRKNMGEAARKRIHQKFSWDIVTKEYEKLFQESV